MNSYRLELTDKRPSADHALVCLSQNSETLYEIQKLVGDTDITQAWFLTETGDYSDIFVGYGQPSFNTPNHFYRVRETDAVIVMFRRDKNGVYALMPYEIATIDGRVTCYTEHGHTAVDYGGCVFNSKPATKEQYAPLLEIMTRIGYDVTIGHKRNYSRYLDAVRKAQYG